jgi:integrase
VPYDLRHTFASLLLSCNVPLLYVSKQLGHAKPTTTLDHYAKWLPSGEQYNILLMFPTRNLKKLAP